MNYTIEHNESPLTSKLIQVIKTIYIIFLGFGQYRQLAIENLDILTPM